MTDETMTHAEITSDEVSSEAPIENEAFEDEEGTSLSDAEEGEAEENEDGLTDDESGDEDDQQSDEDQAEFEAVEVNGKSYKLPKEVIPHIMMEKDYRQKTQTLAEERRVVAHQHESVIAHAQTLREQSELYASIKNVQDQLERYEKFDWVKLHQEDPMQFPLVRMEYEQLREQRAVLANEIQQAAAKSQAQQEQEFLQRAAMATDWGRKNVKGWEKGREDALAVFVRDVLKLPPNVVRANLSPKFVEILHYAELGHQTLHASRASASKAVRTAVQNAKTPAAAPTERVAAKGGKTPVTKPVEKMSMEEYAAWRKKAK